MIELAQPYRLSSRCRFRVVGDEGVVVRLDGAEVVALNGIGAAMLELMRDGTRTLGDVAACIVERFDVDKLVAEQDASEFARELEEAGIVEKAGSP
ncbi:MAG: PqqD family protein [Sandaracinaceae bacterium]|nr:PqqD family protein [Sandaracinaceae bacterium]